jgi:hypothetical protein
MLSLARPQPAFVKRGKMTVGPTILMPKQKHHLQQVTAFTASQNISFSSTTSRPHFYLFLLSTILFLSVPPPCNNPSEGKGWVRTLAAMTMRTSTRHATAYSPSSLAVLRKNNMSPMALGFHRPKNIFVSPLLQPPRFQIMRGCIGHARDPRAWHASWFTQLLLLVVISLLFLAASVWHLVRRCGAVEGARCHQGPHWEWDGRHASEGHALWEEAGRREDTEESGLQPSLHFFRAHFWILLERAIVMLLPHNPFAGWDTSNAGESLTRQSRTCGTP